MYATAFTRDTTVILHVVIKSTASTVWVRLPSLVFVTSKYLRPVILVVEVVVTERAWTHTQVDVLLLLVFFDDVRLDQLSVALSPLEIMVEWLTIWTTFNFIFQLFC
jgi:hypothetical protein